MNNITKYIIAIAILLVSYSAAIPAQSQSDEFTVSLGLGSSALKYQMDEEHSKSGFGGALGVGYTHYFNKVIGISLGVEAEIFNSSIKMEHGTIERQIQTPPGLTGQFLLQANYTGLEEKQKAILLQIPIMFQLQTAINENVSLFFGSGVKVGFPMSSKWNQTIAGLTTTGYSEYMNQQYTNMPNHGFSTYSGLKSSDKLDMKSAVSLALEGGLKFRIGEGRHIYAGVFLDYGLNNIYNAPAKSADILEYNTNLPTDYKFNSILTTSHYSTSDGIKPFAFGVKIKLGFGGGQKIRKPKSVKKPIVPQEEKPDPVWGWE